ncbi:MAG TPA: carboxypeptidase-like regulatory domain-containing protein [Pyrinomonadaceae bacterium]|nr:carboxypeptidase-like regulatory domain-containing protein [Pyrinomonadaceae bacterium]
MNAPTLSRPRRFISLCISLAALLIFIAAISATRSVHAVNRPAQAEPGISFDPTDPSASVGAKVVINAKVVDKDGKEVTPKAGDTWTWKVADKRLEEFLMIERHGSSVSVVGLSGSPKSAATRPNLIPIIVEFKGTPNAMGVVNVRLTDAPLARGPIPPGIDPQVDVMWSVMPQSVTHDNFGNKIKKQFYGIEVVIGNDSGYDLELASVGFDLNASGLKPGNGGLDLEGLAGSRIPTSGYRVTRASLQRRQQLNVRNITLNILKALGPVLTGFTPFFHNINHTNNFVEGVNVLTNPIEKGFEFVWPDLTVGQLANLEDQALRDNSITRTVVKNNTQVRFVVFVPKDLINNSAEPDERKWRDKPLEVMKRLGRMILVGDQVEHINRVRVVSSTETGGQFSIAGKVTDPCLESVGDATVTLTQGSGFSLTTKTDDDGTYHFDNVPSGLPYTVTVSKTDTSFRTPSGNSFTLQGNRAGIDFSAEAAPFTISGTIAKPDGEGDDTSLKDIEVKLTSDSAKPKFELRTAKTDKDGKYKFDNVPGGATYIVTPVLDDRTFSPSNHSSIPSPKCGEEGDEYDFTLEAEEKPEDKHK